MTIRLVGRVVRRPSLPLTDRDEVNLALLREIPIYRQALADLTGESADGPAATASTGSITEAALLHAIFQAGVGAVRAAAEETGYAVMAADQAEQAAQRDQSRRRRPTWADEA
jgi:hypothetical protein